MDWKANPDPGKPEDYEQALEFFRRRVPMTHEAFQRMRNASHRRAFTVAHVTELQIVSQVHTALEKAIAEGTSLAEFKASVEFELFSAWRDAKPHRVETIFRNAVQTSYNHGRWKQMDHPDLMRLRPYRMYDSVRDNNTTDLCRTLDGTVLPADSPHWGSTVPVPQSHHQCRATIRSLRKSEAVRRGITRTPPKVEVPEGWGQKPGDDDFEPPEPPKPPNGFEEPARRKKATATRKANERVETDEERRLREVREWASGMLAELDQPARPIEGRGATEGQGARNGIRAWLDKLGFSSTDVAERRTHRGALWIEPDGIDSGGITSYHAYHNWDGRVVVKESTARKAREVLALLARDGKAGDSLTAHAAPWRALGTLFHEELHGYSNATSASYRGPGAHLEEVGTELLARRVTRELIGRKYSGYSYQGIIDKAVEAVRSTTGESREDAERKLEDGFAATRMHSRESYETPGWHIQALTDAMDITPDQRRKLRDRLNDPKMWEGAF